MGDNTECEKFTSHVYSFSEEQYQRELGSNKFWMQQIIEVILANDDNYGNNIDRQSLQSDNKWLQDWRDFQGLDIIDSVTKMGIKVKEIDVSKTTQFSQSAAG
ncbi:hypothetical protein V6N12_064759 [Hibiscus sabdariffa]|uniref:Uncharacterized protein n=1 Tax=Hibiscus sabdariffa TaxID=183260 RepID=A0ABR2G6S3_9ROSI